MKHIQHKVNTLEQNKTHFYGRRTHNTVPVMYQSKITNLHIMAQTWKWEADTSDQEMKFLEKQVPIGLAPCAT